MSEPEADLDREATANRLMQRLSGFAQGIGLSGTDARQIIGRVIASDPSAGDGELMAKARTWMLIALG
ncbi:MULTISPECIES: hypothetical protein [Methylobacterium]|jgi:hypothetical protein|uniref:Protein of unassigned function n=1 Tax=Methylobacterium oryzae CBMB20 TaxID=693986 RepID=A0A089NPQ7_9HYPH|nr:MULTISPECIES: hypothetical protein [Methylobacterium]AIQ89881.1 protein of unassigned function [Methylobacterium oryzae CBMB20]AWV17896.1 hypothetical protein A3862_22240 [Methylobacterium sp. XJLW]WFS09572.1 hypothetical protein P9K36_09890 [Methylobacterium sp. 391_Methyba4]SFU30972.1 hypothetical protein SAMN02799643_00154 [Methylobacterium sp. UNCCL125]